MSRVRPRRIRHVAVLIESSRGYGRGLIEGVGRYSREHGDWHIYFEPRGLVAPSWLDGWRGDGILSRTPDRALAQRVQDKGIPVVHLHHTATDGQPMVCGDNEAIARLAFTHLWDCGLRQFGYCGLPPEHNYYIHQRGERFRGLAEAAGCACAAFPARDPGLQMSDWERDRQQIAAWLAALPKPVGVLACFDERGFQVLGACRHAGLRVPEEVAVVGVSNDAMLCEMCLPPLTSIDLDAPRIGYEAAALLDRLMRGAKLPDRPLYVAPRRLVARRSTDVLALADPDVVAALRFLRAHACDGIRIDDVLRHLGVSERALERKFRHLLGRTPKAELLRVQVTRAKELLAESDVSLKAVAGRCGFGSERYFSDAFRRITGVRPGAYRRQCRGTGT
jgi:LacI family transcriptional regulator